MGDKTKIAWTDATWNPMIGCSRVSPGCEHCYAERLSGTRLRHLESYGSVVDGDTGRWNGQTMCMPERLDQPIRWRKARIFVCNMGDLFHETVPFEFIAAVFGVMAACPQHTFQVLTKRPEWMLEFFEWLSKRGPHTAMRRMGDDINDPRWQHYACVELSHQAIIDGRLPHYDYRTPWPLPNVWLGVTCEDQKRANDRIPLLLKCPAVVRFVSAEPLLEAIDFGLDLIDWVIVGGESGPKARPFAYEWAIDIRDQCAKSGTACFIKQMGSRPYVENWNLFDLPNGQMGYPIDRGPIGACEVKLRDRAGADPAEWPRDLQVREYPPK